MAVAIDPATGSIFVGGRRQITSTESHFFVVKYDSAGTKQWQHSVSGTADLGTSGGASAVAVDPNGFVFVAGTVGNSGSAADFVIMKMDGRSSRKHVLWTRIVDGAGFDDGVNAMTLTPDGGVAVAGRVGVASGAHNFYLMKFTGDGQDAWPAPQILSGTAAGGLNTASAVGVLPNGDIAVTGWLSNAGTGTDVVVGGFDGMTGARQWFRSLNDPRSTGNDFGETLSMTANGDIVVAGGMASDFSVFKISGSGVPLGRKSSRAALLQPPARSLSLQAAMSSPGGGWTPSRV